MGIKIALIKEARRYMERGIQYIEKTEEAKKIETTYSYPERANPSIITVWIVMEKKKCLMMSGRILIGWMEGSRLSATVSL
ncbi:hypothetical protein ACS127_09675 [Amphibacillus sp. Q70]|uniref:hypothetical protein n=1 Tax=Amphibacillus sp. Q70 TaxID=3453416 RepID=UPI003F87A003